MNADDLPGEGNIMGDIVPSAGPLHSTDLPIGDIAGGLVAPDQVRLPISGQIQHPFDLPGGLNIAGEIGPDACIDPFAQDPVGDVPGGLVLPDQVRLPVFIQIAAAHNLPVEGNIPGDIAPFAGVLDSTH